MLLFTFQNGFYISNQTHNTADFQEEYRTKYVLSNEITFIVINCHWKILEVDEYRLEDSKPEFENRPMISFQLQNRFQNSNYLRNMANFRAGYRKNAFFLMK
jgi:hypothetical protein